MNKIVQISILLLLFFACKNSSRHSESSENTFAEKVKEKRAFITNDSKLYSANDSSDFTVRFGAINGKIGMYLNLTDLLLFAEQLEELKLIITQAEKEFNLDSIYKVHINFFSNCPDLALEVSSIPAIQTHLDSCKKKNVRFLNHKFIGNEILKSKLIQETILCFKKYKFKPSKVWVEKCFATEPKASEKNLLKSELTRDSLRILRCAHLVLEK